MPTITSRGKVFGMVTKYTYLTQDTFQLHVWHGGIYRTFTISSTTGRVSVFDKPIGCVACPVRRVSECPEALGYDCLMLLRETDDPQVWAEVDGRKYVGRPSLTKPDTIDVDTGAGTATVDLRTLKWTFHGREYATLEEAIGSLAAPPVFRVGDELSVNAECTRRTVIEVTSHGYTMREETDHGEVRHRYYRRAVAHRLFERRDPQCAAPASAPIEGALYVFGRACPKLATESRGNPAYDYGNGVHLMRRFGGDWGAWLLTEPNPRAPSAARRRACIAYGRGPTPEDAVRKLQADLYAKASQLIPVGFE